MESEGRGEDAGPVHRTVLVVEDDRDLVETYRLWLRERDDVDPVIVQRGTRALDCLSDGNVDVLVLDRELPGVSGPELLDRAETCSVTVIVVSAYRPDAYLSEDDVDAYVVKPIRKRDFLSTLDGLV